MSPPASRTSLMFGAYLAHLIPPLFVFGDSVHAVLRGVESSSTNALLALSGAYLGVNVVTFVLSRDRRRFVSRIAKPLVGIYSVYVGLVLFEGLARVMVKAPNADLMLWPAGMNFVSETDARQMPGITGTSKFTVNEFGLRGQPLSDTSRYKIIAVGGSSTQCLLLDDSEAWPQLLMDQLNERQNRTRVWVGNAGAGGHTTAHHLMFLKTLPVLSQADALIFLIGINDLQASLAFSGASTDAHLESEVALARDQLVAQQTLASTSLVKQLRLFHMTRRAALTLTTNLGRLSLDENDNVPAYLERRGKRAKQPVVPLPDLRTGLAEYRGRVLQIVDECQKRGLRCIFLTQPGMWRADLSSADQDLLWMGYVGRMPMPYGYVGMSDAAAAIDQYNHALLNVCDEHKLECYDLASAVPKDTSAFFDDFHLNEAGARIVARFLAERLLPKPPFGAERRANSSSAGGSE